MDRGWLRSAWALVLTAACSCGGARYSEREREQMREQARAIVHEQTADHLARFTSEDELRRYVRELARATQLAQRSYAAEPETEASAGEAAPSPAAAPAQATSADAESITNTQVAGVDEGGIVKVHGDHLVVLRRGRLFTIRIGDRELRPVSRIDAYPPGATGGWYDEMLVHDDTIVVVGYNYNESGTELGVFTIDDAGQLRRRGTHYLRSNDYYSSRNYASRLVGNELVVYMPYGLIRGEDYELPAVRSRGRNDWNEVIRASEIYRPIQSAGWPTLHTVVRCDLSRPELACRAQGIVGPHGRSFFVSQSAVYVWVGGEGERLQGEPESVVYRLPFDGSEPGAVRVAGMPTDQFSFQEAQNHLDVLVRAEAVGDWMWAPEVSSGDVALVRMPLALFSDGVTTAPRGSYTRLPRIEGYAFQNRFVGRHVLYGSGSGWGPAAGNGHGQVVVHGVDDGNTAVLSLPHVVDRLEVMGPDAVVIGSGGGALHFSAVELDASPSVVGHYERPGASQGETRSHGFFYRPESLTSGVLGLPIRGADAAGYHQLTESSAGVLFVRVDQRQFRPLGVLASQGGEVNDQCQASCVDWYGNARPIFVRGRVIALLGYELVEGVSDGASIREIARTNFFRDLPRETAPR